MWAEKPAMNEILTMTGLKLQIFFIFSDAFSM